MREGTYGDEIHATLGILAYRVERYAAARLGLEASCYNLDSLPGVGNGEVVEHDAVYAAVVDYLLQLVEVSHLYLYLQLQTLLLKIFVATVYGVRYASGKVHVVVF